MMPFGNRTETVPGKPGQFSVLLTVTGEETYADGHKDRARTVSLAACEKSGGACDVGDGANSDKSSASGDRSGAPGDKSGAGKQDGCFRVFRYREEDPAGGGTDSVIGFSDGCCSIVRTGLINTEMRFVPHETTRCIYGTPYGSIPMTICTRLVAVRRVGDNFHARVRYQLTPEGADPMECAVTIKAEPCD
ncbi:MAG: DUF1934 domain-containing protein [Lachnospiraceae bacterium]|nr:DUF1934 domain-containing protein [Lachnospiraceae bacterium]